MSEKIACYTLFDITKTNVPNRSRPPDGADYKNWVYQRNSQINFDTIVQIISLRSQPENISVPVQLEIKEDFFGLGKSTIGWMFNFEVRSLSVYSNGNDELAYLKQDVADVPMLICGTEFSNLTNVLSAEKPTKNIHFIKY
jgi:hypothetical protein